MKNPLLPGWIAEHLFTYDPAQVSSEQFESLRNRLAQFRTETPLVSIVIPAYNEEASLLNTLSSLASQRLTMPTELLVVNNNSSDRTQAFLDQCGVRSVLETQPGVAYARQAGLLAARGQFVANADSDCLYPPDWVNAITSPLQKSAIACTYGLYSFLPHQNTSRFALACYERVSHTLNFARSFNKPYLNVYGFNFAFRRDDALAIGGYALDSGPVGSVAELVEAGKTPPPPSARRGEDGWMALSLREQGKGGIHRVTDSRAHVWTSARRLLAHGSLGKAFMDRIRRTLS
ncbi:glycosyltransferase family 2 protein [Spirosoma knui]